MNARRWHRARYVVLLVIPIALAGCDVFGASERFFAEDQTYEHRFFETYEACLAAQPDPNFFINCSQWVDFYTDGRVELTLTDIINPGTYRIKGTTITLTMAPSPEVSEAVTFTLAEDEQSIVDEFGVVWTLKNE